MGVSEQDPRPEELAYLRRVEALLDRYEAILGSEALKHSRDLIEHGEPPIGLNFLAWELDKSDHHVSEAEKAEIRELMTPDEVPHLPDAWK